MKAHKIMTLDGEEFVLVPRAEYLSMTGVLPGTVEAAPFMRSLIAKNLRVAREAAGFTQDQLALKLKKSQPLVSGAETGTVSVGEAYIASVLKACGLPKDWTPPSKGIAPRASAGIARPKNSGIARPKVAARRKGIAGKRAAPR